MQYLQKLPWESISILKSRSVSRMPSLHSLIGLSIQQEVRLCPIMAYAADMIYFLTVKWWIFVLSFSIFHFQTDSQSILRQGVDTRQVFYVLDPDANLGNSQDRFKEWFSR